MKVDYRRSILVERGRIKILSDLVPTGNVDKDKFILHHP